MPQTRKIKPVSTFATIVAQAKLSLRELARKSEVPHQTLYGVLRPEHHAGRKGAISAKNAWKIAQGFAQHTGKTDQEAFDDLFIVDAADRE